uniref:Uncharacterized protein n=1 Tax=Rhizophora mucronata TaxID=61149 RepID=A0A2P2PBZ8_RHIMU
MHCPIHKNKVQIIKWTDMPHKMQS